VLRKRSGPEFDEVVAITAKHTGARPDLIRRGFPYQDRELRARGPQGAPVIHVVVGWRPAHRGANLINGSGIMEVVRASLRRERAMGLVVTGVSSRGS